MVWPKSLPSVRVLELRLGAEGLTGALPFRARTSGTPLLLKWQLALRSRPILFSFNGL